MLKSLIFILFLGFIASLQSQWTVYKTTNSGLPSNDVGKVVFDAANVKWIATSNGLARFNGTIWTVYDTANSPLPAQNVSALAFEQNNVLWIGTGGGGVAKYDGINWTIYDTLNSPLPSNSISTIVVDLENKKWFCTTKGLAKFDDINWAIFNTANSGLPGNNVTCLALEDTVKWLGTIFNGIAKFDNTSWQNYTFQNSGLSSNNIFGITVDNLGNKWIATMFGGIAKLNSFANQWTIYNTSNSGLPHNHNNTVITQNHIKWIGSWGGVAKFNDTTWVVFDPTNSPLPDYYITSLSIDNIGRLWISTPLGLAVYNSGLIGINIEGTITPKTYELKQNYPNPFNPVTTIEFDLPHSSNVQLRIYDVTGKEIYSVNEFKTAGSYKLEFDASAYASGVYFYSIEAGSFRESRKMVLVK